MRGSYVGWGPQGSLVWRMELQGIRKESFRGSQARKFCQEDWEGLLHHVGRGQPGTGWEAKKNEEGILVAARED